MEHKFYLELYRFIYDITLEKIGAPLQYFRMWYEKFPYENQLSKGLHNFLELC